MIFIEKYKPKTFDDIIGNGEKIKDIVENGDIPNLLFYGPPGTGKTATVNVIVKQLGLTYIKLNASDERGIDILRGKLRDFAMTASSNGKKKVIWLDEIEALTGETMDALRGFMDDFGGKNIFMGTTNYLYKVPDPIQSRFTKIEYSNIPIEIIHHNLKGIVENENIDIGDDVLIQLIKSCNQDIRSCINKLEEFSKLKREIVIDDLKNDFVIVEKIHLLLKQKKFIDARQLYLDTPIKPEDFVNDYHSYIMDLTIKKEELTPDTTKKLIEKFFECISVLKFSANSDIVIDWLFIKIMENI